MQIQLHPKVEQKLALLTEFYQCASQSHCLAEVIKREVEKPDFKKWLSEQNASPATPSLLSPTHARSSKKGHANGVAMADGKVSQEGV